MRRKTIFGNALLVLTLLCTSLAFATAETPTPVVLKAAHLLDVNSGKLISNPRLLIEGERIIASGKDFPSRRMQQLSTWAITSYCPALLICTFTSRVVAA